MYRTGTPVTINGRTAGTPGPATTTPTRVRIPNPSRRQGVLDAVAPMAYARRITFNNLEAVAGTELRVYMGNQKNPDFITVHPQQSLIVEANMTEFTVQTATGTAQWEALAIVAS